MPGSPYLIYTSNWVRYTAYSEEVCPSTGKKHFQGFLETHEPVSMNKIKLWMPKNYLAIRNGTLAQNKSYCSKEGTLIECGERPAQGRRVDLISTDSVGAETSGTRRVLINLVFEN